MAYITLYMDDPTYDSWGPHESLFCGYDSPRGDKDVVVPPALSEPRDSEPRPLRCRQR